MTNIKEISQKITSISSTKQITKAMKMVSASHFGKLHSMTIKFKRFLETIENIITKIDIQKKDFIYNPFFKQRSQVKNLFVIVSSDKGLCGAYNSNIFKFAKREIENFQFHNPQSNVEVMPLGEKGVSFFEKCGYSLNKEYVNLVHSFNLKSAKELSYQLQNNFISKRLDQIFLIYTNFKTASSVSPVIERYLPIKMDRLPSQQESQRGDDYIFEASKEATMDIVLPNYLAFQLYGAILKSKSAENSSRMITMNKALDNSENLLKDLTLEFNRTRQAIITQEISEVTSGAEVSNN